MSPRSFVGSALSFVLVAGLAAPLAGCGSSTEILQIPTSWTLQTSRSHALPDTVPNSTPVIVITSGSAQISDNHDYTFTIHGTTDGVQGVVASDAGTWSISSSTFLFRSSSSSPHVDPYVGAFNGSTFNVAMPASIVHSSDPSVAMVFVTAP
jgi:hypothetical protein